MSVSKPIVRRLDTAFGSTDVPVIALLAIAPAKENSTRIPRFQVLDSVGVSPLTKLMAAVGGASRARRRQKPHPDRPRSDRARRDPGAAAGRRRHRHRAAGRLRPLRHAGALHDVRRRDLAGADPAALLRRRRRQGRRGGIRRTVLFVADLPSRAGGIWGGRGDRGRDAAEGFFQSEAVGSSSRGAAHLAQRLQGWRPALALGDASLRNTPQGEGYGVTLPQKHSCSAFRKCPLSTGAPRNT
jgi:hypothetical protein